jgi:hypothetical protein
LTDASNKAKCASEIQVLALIGVYPPNWGLKQPEHNFSGADKQISRDRRAMLVW